MNKYLLVFFLIVSCGKVSKNTVPFSEPDMVPEIGEITFDITDQLETNLEEDSFVIPSIYQNQSIKYKIVLYNKSLSTKSISLSSDDENFNIINPCSSIRSRIKCSIEISNIVKNVGSYSSSFMLQGKEINFSLNILPAVQPQQSPIQLSSSSLVIDKPTALVVKNNSLTNSDITVDSSASSAIFSFDNKCTGSLASRKSCVILVSLKPEAVNGQQSTFKVNNQNIQLTVLKSVVSPAVSSLSISSSENNFSFSGSKSLSFRILNSSLSSAELNQSQLSGLTHNCPPVLSSRKSCTANYNLNSDSYKQGSQVINLNVLNKNIQIMATVLKPECQASSRISSSKCDQSNNDSFMNKHVINNTVYPEAVCNDGSPAAFFKRSGVGSGSKRWVIHLEEGGFCGEFPLSIGAMVLYFNVCPLRRQQTPQYVSTLNDSSAYKYPNGILGGTESSNPDFYSWNHVEVRYCSSDIWSGNTNKTIGSEPYVWKFRGVNILDAVFNTLLNEHGLAQAQNIILSGSSAGGFGVLAQGDYLKENFLEDKDVALLSDSAWTQDFNNANGHNFFDLLFKRNITYLNGSPDESCTSRLGVNSYRCFLGQEAYSDLATPTFIIQDQMDEFYLNIGYGVASICSANASQKNLITNFATQMRSQLSNKVGIVSPRSFSHVFLTSSRWNNTAILNNQISIKDVFSNWYFNKPGAQSFIAEPSVLENEIFNFCN